MLSLVEKEKREILENYGQLELILLQKKIEQVIQNLFMLYIKKKLH
jgi:hypothetical protein